MASMPYLKYSFYATLPTVNLKRNEHYLKAFGENLRKLRKKQGLSMMQLAFEAEIEYSQIAKIERGLINTTISTAYTLATALNLKPEELFKFDYSPKDK